MQEGFAKQFEPLWGKWYVKDYLGEGSCGKVWLLNQKETDNDSALKEIVISADLGNYRQALAEGLDIYGMKGFFRSAFEETLQEINIMKELSFCPNIVRFDDVLVFALPDKRIIDLSTKDKIRNLDADGWVILIRMELLTPLKNRIMDRSLLVSDIHLLGLHMCKALIACEDNYIIHRDIKPDNIFWKKDDNSFKLGDFGLARMLNRPTEEKGRTGTLTHMSPEVYSGKPFSIKDDLYALGMMLYKLLNENRIPFLPRFPQPYTPRERDRALYRRLEGDNPPLPTTAYYAGNNQIADFGFTIPFSETERELAAKLGIIAQKAISSDLSARYISAQDMYDALSSLI